MEKFTEPQGNKGMENSVNFTTVKLSNNSLIKIPLLFKLDSPNSMAACVQLTEYIPQ